MTDLLLVVLALSHYGYEAGADALGVTPQRVFYIFQGGLGLGFFVMAGLRARPHWAPAARWALHLVALCGCAEQALVIGCGCGRLWEPVFRAPRGEGLCGGGWYGVGLAVVAWLAAMVWWARRAGR